MFECEFQTNYYSIIMSDFVGNDICLPDQYEAMFENLFLQINAENGVLILGLTYFPQLTTP